MTEPRPAGLPWLRLGTQGGWPLATELSRGLADGLEIALGMPGQRPIADTEPLGSFGGRRLPRGLAIASDGRIYVADPIRRVILTSLAGEAAQPRPAGAAADWPFVPLWPARPLPQAAPHDLGPPRNPPADPWTLVRPVALALTPGGDLVIADAGKDGAGRVLVIGLPQGVVRHVIGMVEPVAVSIDATGRACIADAGARGILRFDRNWRREPGYPHPSVPPIDGLAHLAHACPGHGGACSCGCGATCGCDAPGAPEPDLWFIAKGRLHALTREGFAWANGAFAAPGTLPAAAPSAATCLAPPPLVLGDDASLRWADPAFPGRDALALPGLVPDRTGRLAGTSIALLARPRRIELPRTGIAQFKALDGRQEGFAWDRVALAAEVPVRTRLLLSTLTTDAALEEAQLADQPAAAWSPPLEIGPGDPGEILIQSGSGRFLWLRIEMFGDGARTPRLRGIDIFAPRRSSLADLPPPFREDAESAAFLDRFLAYFDTVFAEIGARHAAVPALFDPHAVPSGPFLDWLASWFDIAFLPEWPEPTRRTMVAQAIAMYRRRGTVAGLRQMLQWHTGLGDPAPAVIEHFRIRQPTWVAGVPLAPPDGAHRFTIVLPATAAPDDAARARLAQVIEAAIPAHAHYDLRLVAPGIAIGRQSTLGVDMLLGTLHPHPLGEARLGGDAMFPPFQPPPLPAPMPGGPCPC